MNRVLQVMGSLSSGGIQVTVMEYYRAIDRSRFQFDFLVNDEEGPGTQFYEEEALSLGARVFHRPRRMHHPFASRRALAAVLAANTDIKLVHFHTSSHIAVLDVLTAKRLKIPVRIVQSHHQAIKLAVWQAPLRPLLRACATHWWACADAAGCFLFGDAFLNRQDTFIMPNARNMGPYYFNEQVRHKTREGMALQGKLVLLHVGRLEAAKNQIFLLECVKEMLKREPDTVLLLVGRGSLQNQLQQKAGELKITQAVRFLGERTDIPDLLQAADVFLLPSLNEGLPGVAVEAQAADLPALLSDRITKEVQITDGVQFLSIEGTQSLWADTALSLQGYRRRDRAEEMRQTGYDIRTAANSLEHRYTQMLQGIE